MSIVKRLITKVLDVFDGEDEEDEPVEKAQEVKAAPNPKKKSEDKPENLSVEPTSALNGAQIQAALSVIEQITRFGMLISDKTPHSRVMKQHKAIRTVTQ